MLHENRWPAGVCSENENSWRDKWNLAALQGGDPCQGEEASDSLVLPFSFSFFLLLTKYDMGIDRGRGIRFFRLLFMESIRVESQQNGDAQRHWEGADTTRELKDPNSLFQSRACDQKCGRYANLSLECSHDSAIPLFAAYCALSIFLVIFLVFSSVGAGRRESPASPLFLLRIATVLVFPGPRRLRAFRGGC